VGQRSETGYVRAENQDRMSWIRTPIGDVFVVLDGMGGHVGGGIAAELAVQVIQNQFADMNSLESAPAKLRAVLSEANDAVYARSQSLDPAMHGMGTTVVAMFVAGSRIMLAHVGDSRAYLMTRKGRLLGLTKDHSRVQRMVDTGVLTEAEAARHADAGILERALGHTAHVEVETSGWTRVHAGEIGMLCSDGLCGYVDDANIAAVLRRKCSPQQHADELVKLALERGGADNVTVQVVKFERGVEPGWRRALHAASHSWGFAVVPVAFVGVLGAGWLLSLPVQRAPEPAADPARDQAPALASALASAHASGQALQLERDERMRHDAVVASQVAAIEARLERLEQKLTAASAPVSSSPSHAPRTPPAKAKSDVAHQPAAGRTASSKTPSRHSKQPDAATPDAAPANGNAKGHDESGGNS
jgi:serine/threonine protein phosphatase PrpC